MRGRLGLKVPRARLLRGQLLLAVGEVRQVLGDCGDFLEPVVDVVQKRKDLFDFRT